MTKKKVKIVTAASPALTGEEFGKAYSEATKPKPSPFMGEPEDLAQIKNTLADLAPFINANNASIMFSANVGKPENMEEIQQVRDENAQIAVRNKIAGDIFQVNREKVQKENRIIEELNSYLRGDLTSSSLQHQALRALSPFDGGGMRYAGEYPDLKEPQMPTRENLQRVPSPIFNKATVQVAQRPIIPRGGGGKAPKPDSLEILSMGPNNTISKEKAQDSQAINKATFNAKINGWTGVIQALNSNANTMSSPNRKKTEELGQFTDQLLFAGMYNNDPNLKDLSFTYNGQEIPASQALDANGRFKPGLGYAVKSSALPAREGKDRRANLLEDGRKWDDHDEKAFTSVAQNINNFLRNQRSSYQDAGNPMFEKYLWEGKKNVTDEGKPVVDFTDAYIQHIATEKTTRGIAGKSYTNTPLMGHSR